MRQITKYVGNNISAYNMHWISEENNPTVPHWRLETSNSEICRCLYESKIPNILPTTGGVDAAWTPENTMGWYVAAFKKASHETLETVKILSECIGTLSGQDCTFAIYPIDSDIAITLDKNNNQIEIGKYEQKIINA